MNDQSSYEQAYLAPLKKFRARFKVQGSRFIATLAPSSSEKKAFKILSEIRAEFPDATHHPYALRLGTGSVLIERCHDDHEPAGTAGAPMLQVLQGKTVSDCILIGTRYFGGTKLGIGGLTRAYRECARLGLEKASLTKKEALDTLSLTLHYEDIGSVTRLLESLDGSVLNADYGEEVKLTVSLPIRSTRPFLAGFQSTCRSRGSWQRLKS